MANNDKFNNIRFYRRRWLPLRVFGTGRKGSLHRNYRLPIYRFRHECRRQFPLRDALYYSWCRDL